MRRFYKRSGISISRKKVNEAKKRLADSYRIGKLIGTDLPLHINIKLADRIEKMSEEEFCNYSGMATYHNFN